jgi:hypothetical protein
MLAACHELKMINIGTSPVLTTMMEHQPFGDRPPLVLPQEPMKIHHSAVHGEMGISLGVQFGPSIPRQTTIGLIFHLPAQVFNCPGSCHKPLFDEKVGESY